MTHAQWLATLEWRGGPLPSGTKHRMPVGIVARDDSGDVVLVGDVNQVGGVCDCCASFDARGIVAWAWLPGWPMEDEAMGTEGGRYDG